MHARKEETVQKRKANQKERRQQKCEVLEEHKVAIDDELKKVDDGHPQFKNIARYTCPSKGNCNILGNIHRKLIEQFELECSPDWLREKIRTRWQSGTGIGALRRAQYSLLVLLRTPI